ncbi:CBO0543 family protein [Litchfieldia alkalitelluris]|uniref:CBO0543 family protein n=1 Tax=Litchfieldia alkalitelluris TaxID=304268 RepID=UPI000995EAA4|nr:CBO0543 family protein [Litchfieldia alkalitelluris]
MNEKQEELLHKIRATAEELSRLHIDYWKEYSSFDDVKFWVVVFMLIVPLVILLFNIERKYALLLGFYGLNYHIWFAYTNSAGIRMGLWDYPYEILPVLPSFALDASFVPIAYMLLYQWVLKNNKNFYLYSTILSAFFAFILKPILVMHELFRMFKGINYFYLFFFYVLFFVISRGITNLFLKLQDNK